MTELPLDYDPISGLSCSLAFDSDGSMRVLNKQDNAAIRRIVDGNKRLQNADLRKKRDGDMAHYASIPDIVWMDWRDRLGVDIFNKDHKKELFRLLNSPDYQYLKTTTRRHEG